VRRRAELSGARYWDGNSTICLYVIRKEESRAQLPGCMTGARPNRSTRLRRWHVTDVARQLDQTKLP
jgi:hypothetical protein